MSDKKVNVIVSWKYVDARLPTDAEPNNEASIVWRGMDYDMMVEIEGRLIAMLTELNAVAREKGEIQMKSAPQK